MAKSNITNITLKTYDKIVVDKFASRVLTKEDGQKSMSVVYAPPELAFEYAMKRQVVDKTKSTNNQIVLPMISIYRPSGFSLSDMTHQVLGHNRSSFYVKYIDEDRNIALRNIQRLFVDIPYQLDIWTSDESVMAEVVQSVLFLLMREQYIDARQLIEGIELPDGTYGDVSYTFKLTLENSINDNTRLESESDNGKLYRYTLVFMIEDAILVRDTSAPYIKVLEFSEKIGNEVVKSDTIVFNELEGD